MEDGQVTADKAVRDIAGEAVKMESVGVISVVLGSTVLMSLSALIVIDGIRGRRKSTGEKKVISLPLVSDRKNRVSPS